jgi:hypothetical protein
VRQEGGGGGAEIHLKLMMASWKRDSKFPACTLFNFKMLTFTIGSSGELVLERNSFRFPLGLNNSATMLLGSIRASGPPSGACLDTHPFTDLSSGSTSIVWGHNNSTSMFHRQIWLGALLQEPSWKMIYSHICLPTL